MGTYEKQYSIKWINFNVENSVMEAEFNVKAVLDGEEEFDLPTLRAKIEGEKYGQLFSIPATIWLNETTLGEFIGYMSSSAGQLTNSEFPIHPDQTTKWGTQGVDLLSSE